MISSKKLFLFFSILGISQVAIGQSLFLNDDMSLETRVYAGGSYLYEDAPDLTDSYYSSLRYGFNFGGDLIFFYQKIGLGFNYDYSIFSAKGFSAPSGETIDEDNSVAFYGPLLAVRSKINRQSSVTAYFAYGRQVFDNEAVIDGVQNSLIVKKSVSKLSLVYSYKISEFSIGIGLQFFGGNEPERYTLLPLRRVSPFTPPTVTYTYRSGATLNRLGLNIGGTYSF
ncbi:MAG: hypothetical protein RIM99_02515 [Cyclobacteriaceae bacterium]